MSGQAGCRLKSRPGNARSTILQTGPSYHIGFLLRILGFALPSRPLPSGNQRALPLACELVAAGAQVALLQLSNLGDSGIAGRPQTPPEGPPNLFPFWHACSGGETGRALRAERSPVHNRGGFFSFSSKRRGHWVDVSAGQVGGHEPEWIRSSGLSGQRPRWRVGFA